MSMPSKFIIGDRHLNRKESLAEANKVKIDNLMDTMRNWERGFLKTFQGIPVKVNNKLTGNQYEIHISPEQYAKLELMKKDIITEIQNQEDI